MSDPAKVTSLCYPKEGSVVFEKDEKLKVRDRDVEKLEISILLDFLLS